MQTHTTRKPHDTARPARKQLTLRKETLRRLTPAALRLAAGGTVLGAAPALSPYSMNPPCVYRG